MSDLWNEIFEQNDAPIQEEFDPTWPFNFKWAYDGQTGHVDVWRVQGGIDGRPTHRAEVRERWGREVNIGNGDILGVATYVPPEIKFSGEVVAPADLQMQAYYGKPIPKEITQYFENAFPDAIVRQGTVVHKRLGKHVSSIDTRYSVDRLAPLPEGNPCLKWIWNPQDGLLVWQANSDNMPTHNSYALQHWNRYLKTREDSFGYAFQEPGKIEVESWNDEPIPPQAWTAVKQQLLEWFPKDQVVNMNEAEADSLGTDPHDWHFAALEWVAANLGSKEAPGKPSEPSESLSNDTPGILGRLTRFFRRRRTADADMDGAMVGLFVPEEIGKKLQVANGEPLKNLHITLLYFQDKAKDRDDWDEVRRIVEQVANQTPRLSGEVSGYGVFQAEDGDVLWASPSILGLAELRHKLYEACEEAGFRVNQEHDWVPHITLKYKHTGKLPEGDVKLDFPELSFAQGDEHDDYKLTGRLEKRAAEWDITIPGEPGEHIDGWHFTDRTPYIFYPEHDLVYYGQPGQYHYSLKDWILHNGTHSVDDPAIFGSIYSDPRNPNNKFQETHNRGMWPNAMMDWDSNERELPQDEKDALEKRIGVPFGRFNDPELTNDELNQGDIWNQMFGKVGSGNDYLDWSGWEGAHRFVTDGKELMTDPETETINPDAWRGDVGLTNKFRSFHPDAKSLVSGWIVPTSDGMGLGIYAPAAGHGDKHEPGLHDIIAVVEKEQGKPAHLITNPDHLTDSKMYSPTIEEEWKQL